MKLFLIFFLVTIVLSSVDHWFAQKIDHFNRLDQSTFQQRYWKNDTFFGGAGSPIFLAFAGEAPLDSFYGVESGLLVDLARENNAVLLYLEHRYYGKSYPFGVEDTSTNSMRFLSTQQAITDGIGLIEFFLDENKLPSDTPVISFGCSYSGMMSSFFRTQFPHAAIAAVAGSAPVLAQADFGMYDDTIFRVLGDECSQVVKKALLDVDNLAEKGTGRDQLVSLFDICEGVNFDHPQLMYQLAGFVMDAVQGNNPDAGFPVKKMCQVLSQGSDPLAAFTKYVKQENEGCLQTDFVSDLYSANSGRSWWFQKCTEYGYFKTDHKRQIFSPITTLEWYLSICRQVFGTALVPDTEWTNLYFGGLDIQGTNILFTNGNFDPWATLGIRKNISATLPVYMYDGAHCAPFHHPTGQDPINLIETRQAIHQFVSSALAQ